MTMSKLEALPKEIIVGNKYYYLNVWTTFKSRLCVGYRDMDKYPWINTLFSIVIEPENEEYLPDISTDLTSLINEVGNCKSLDRACDVIKESLMNHDLFVIIRN